MQMVDFTKLLYFFAATVTTEHRLAAVLVENGVTGGSGYKCKQTITVINLKI